MNRIKEITLEVFSKQFTDELLRVQQDLRQEINLNDRIKREWNDRESQLISEFETKSREL